MVWSFSGTVMALSCSIQSVLFCLICVNCGLFRSNKVGSWDQINISWLTQMIKAGHWDAHLWLSRQWFTIWIHKPLTMPLLSKYVWTLMPPLNDFLNPSIRINPLFYSILICLILPTMNTNVSSFIAFALIIYKVNRYLKDAILDLV